MFARAEQLTNSWRVCRRAVIAGYPLVVVVDREGELRGFHNVCRHRAGPLVDDGEGRASGFVCRYHGWSYDTTGRLINARDFDPSGRRRAARPRRVLAVPDRASSAGATSCS